MSSSGNAKSSKMKKKNNNVVDLLSEDELKTVPNPEIPVPTLKIITGPTYMKQNESQDGMVGIIADSGTSPGNAKCISLEQVIAFMLPSAEGLPHQIARSLNFDKQIPKVKLLLNNKDKSEIKGINTNMYGLHNDNGQDPKHFIQENVYPYLLPILNQLLLMFSSPPPPLSEVHQMENAPPPILTTRTTRSGSPSSPASTTPKIPPMKKTVISSIAATNLRRRDSTSSYLDSARSKTKIITIDNQIEYVSKEEAQKILSDPIPWIACQLKRAAKVMNTNRTHRTTISSQCGTSRTRSTINTT